MGSEKEASDRDVKQGGFFRSICPLSRDATALLFISACWIAAILLVNPLGEFPSVDDWSYLLAVRALAESGEIRFSDWTGVNLLSHVVWGSLFAVPLGGSYTTLRISTLVAALLGSYAVFGLVRCAGQPTSVSTLASLALLFNPIFFVLSFGFMTDVPYVAAQSAAMVFLFLGLQQRSRLASAAGWLLTLVALLSRQTALVIPFAYVGAYLGKHGVAPRRVAVAVLPLLAFLGVQWGYEYWLSATERMSPLFGENLNSVVPMLTTRVASAPRGVFEMFQHVFFYTGLLLLPVTLPAIATISQAFSSKGSVAMAIAAVAATVAISWLALNAGLVMPNWPNTWHSTGIGSSSSGIPAPHLFLEVVTVLSVLGGVLLAMCLVLGAVLIVRRDPDTLWAYTFALLGAAGLTCILSLIFFKWDRYLLPIVPWLVLAVALAMSSVKNAAPRWSLVASSILLAGIAWYSVVSGHNYMAERRVWVMAIHDLVAQGVPRDTIDATWVFDGEDLFGYGRNAQKTARMMRWYTKRDYVIGTNRRPRVRSVLRDPNYQVYRRYQVPRWPLWGRRGSPLLVFGPKT